MKLFTSCFLRTTFFCFFRLALVNVLRHIKYVSCQIYTIYPYAGSVYGFSGDGGPASSALMSGSVGAFMDSQSNLYIADTYNHRIRKVAADTKVITTIAGNGIAKLEGDGGPATLASINTPKNVWVSTTGLIYFAEPENHRVRVVSANGIINTFAGMNVRGVDKGCNGDTAATSFMLHTAYGIAGDVMGNIYFSEYTCHRVRKITAATGIVTTIAGTGTGGFSSSQDGSAGTSAMLQSPTGLSCDFSGNIYVADTKNYRIRKVTSGGIISTAVGTGTSSYADGPGTSASIKSCSYLWADSLGQLFFSDDGAYVVRKLDTAGIVSTIAGTGTKGTVNFNVAATSSNIGDPRGLTGDTAGNIYFYDYYANYIYKLSSSGGILSIAVGTGSSSFSMGYVATSTLIGTPYNIFLVTDGTLYMSDLTNHRISKLNLFTTGALSSVVAGTGEAYLAGDEGLAGSAVLNGVTGLYMDSIGNLYFADSSNFRIRKIDMNGIITAFCGSIVVGMPGTGTDHVTATSSYLNSPFAVFGDTLGAIYITDNYNVRLRRVSATGIITTFGGGGASFLESGPATSTSMDPCGLFVATDGNIFIADLGNHRIRKITPSGIISTIIGNGAPYLAGDNGLASSASIRGPRNLWMTSNGDIYVADTDNHRVRKMSAATGIITTLAGTGSQLLGGFGGDGGPATAARLSLPVGIYYDKSSNILYLTDANNRIRKFSVSAGIISTVTSIGTSPGSLIGDTSGNLYYTQSKYVYKLASGMTTSASIAGNGGSTFSGDGGQATTAGVSTPKGIYMDTTGVIYFSDIALFRIRKIDTTGIITTICGTGSSGVPNESGPASSSKIAEVYGIVGDGSGNIYFADYTYKKIRVIDTSGMLTTFAGTGASGYSASHEGGLATSATLYNPKGIWVDSQSNLFLADRNNNRIRKISISTTIITTVAGNGGTTLGVGDGGAPTSASIYFPESVYGDTVGNLFIAEFGNHRIRKIDLLNNIISTIAGSGTTVIGVGGAGTNKVLSTDTMLYGPRSVTSDSTGAIYIVDSDNFRITRLMLTNFPTSQPSSQPSSQPASHPTYQPSRQPTSQPSHQPSFQPSTQPSIQPTASPTNPTGQPSRHPSCSPTNQPTLHPTSQPTTQPSNCPSTQPTRIPTAQPWGKPSSQPTYQPSNQPTTRPSKQPSNQPTEQPFIQPTTRPSSHPTSQPISHPTSQPTLHPSVQPTRQPSTAPTREPSRQPTVKPTNQPTCHPSSYPSIAPTTQPTDQPSGQPSTQPSQYPTTQPTIQPSIQPTSPPTRQPSMQPAAMPSNKPTSQPISNPTNQPSTQPTRQPACQPSHQPTKQPTQLPSSQPSGQPTLLPTVRPSTQPSNQPSSQPVCYPTSCPSGESTSQPSSQPSTQPSQQPSNNPSNQPSCIPSRQPTKQPTTRPSLQPSSQPSSQPVAHPSQQPSNKPSLQPISQPTSPPSTRPSNQPSSAPSVQPNNIPTTQPSQRPSAQPSHKPTIRPTHQPSMQPTSQPNTQPTWQPTIQPSMQPVSHPTCQPSTLPSCQPSTLPSCQPSMQPSVQPINGPTFQPSAQPSSQPSIQLTSRPTLQPSQQPTQQPTNQPSWQPTNLPSQQPTLQPTDQPSYQPTYQPSSQPIPTPTCVPSSRPSQQPVCNPSIKPTSSWPSLRPTSSPSGAPSGRPSRLPSSQPTFFPIASPTTYPSAQPTIQPVTHPSVQPTNTPSSHPSESPSSIPSTQPQADPTYLPTQAPMKSYRFVKLTEVSFCDTENCILFTLNMDIVVVGISTTFRCKDLLYWTPLPTAMAGDNPTCFFITSSQIKSYDVQSFDVNMTMTLSPDASSKWLIKRVCNNGLDKKCVPNHLEVDVSIKVSVLLGNNPIVPRLIINPSPVFSVGSCEDVTIDLTSSTGFVGRRWKSYNVSVVAGLDVSQENVTSIQTRIVQEFGKTLTSMPFVVPRQWFLTSIYPYDICISMCNTLNRCSSLSIVVNVTDRSSVPPYLEVIGSSKRLLTKSSTLSVSILTYVTRCSTSSTLPVKVSGERLQVTWKLFRMNTDNSTSIFLNIKSIASEKTKYFLPAYSLNVSSTYLLEVSVRDPQETDLSLTRAMIVRVDVVSLPLVPIITPNRPIIQYRADDSPIVLQALTSYDPNVQKQYSEPELRSLFSFSWHCQQVKNDFISSQGGYVSNEKLLDVWLSSNSTSDMIFAPCTLNVSSYSNSLQVMVSATKMTSVGSINVVILTMRDKSSFITRQSSVAVQIILIPPQAPMVTMETSFSDVTKVNVQNKFILTGSIFTTSTCIASWSLLDNLLLQVSDIAASPSFIKTVNPNVRTAVTLVIKSNGFPSEDASYTFALSCDDSSARLLVTTNGPPTGGSFIIAPNDGQELSTLFVMSANQWNDADLPLSYQFGYYSSNSMRVEMVVRSRMELSSASSVLPSGRAATSNALTCFVSIFDSLLALTTSTTNVQVLEAHTTNLDRLLTEKLQQSGLLMQIGNTNKNHTSENEYKLSVEELKQLVSVSSSILNKVNCTKAPDCIGLNRQNCDTKAHTCGECLTGFLGEIGNSNSPCVNPTKITTNKLLVAQCENDTDCKPWEMCRFDGSSGSFSCMEKLKACPLDCSGHGQCRYFNSESGMELTVAFECTLFRTDCEPRCLCSSPFVGSSCSITAEELETKQRLREALLQGVAQLITVPDLDDQAIINAASYLQSLTMQSDELSMESVETATFLASMVVHQSMTYRDTSLISYKSVLPLLGALDVSLAKATSTVESSNTSINIIGETVSTIGRLGDLIFRESVEGENVTDLLYKDIRITSQASSFIYTAQSDLERLQNKTPSAYIQTFTPKSNTIRLLTAGDDDNIKTQQLQTIELKQKVWRQNESYDRLQSNFIVVKTMNVDKVQIVMSREQLTPQSYNENYQSLYNLTTRCKLNEIKNESFVCPDSGITIATTCHGQAGLNISYCPTPLTQCGSISLDDQSIIKPQCKTTKITIDEVTCECEIPQTSAEFLDTLGSASSRGMWSTGIGVVDKTGSLAIVLMVEYVGTDMIDTFHAAPYALSSLEDTEKVLTVILLYGVMWSLGAVLIFIFAIQRFARNYNEQLRRTLLIQKKLKQRRGCQVVGTEIQSSVPASLPRRKSVLDVLPDFLGRRDKKSVIEEEHISMEEMEKHLLDYVYQILPEFFRTSSILLAIETELAKHHSYIHMFSHSDSAKLPVLTICQLLTIQTASMFLLAILYDVQGPNDDGSCQVYKTERECLQTQSVFDYDQTYCKWIGSSDEAMWPADDTTLCVYNPVKMNIKIGLYCAILVSVSSSILMYPLDYLFSIINAPLSNSSEQSPNAQVSPIEETTPAVQSIRNSTVPQSSGLFPLTVITTPTSRNHTIKYIPIETKEAYGHARISIMKQMRKQQSRRQHQQDHLENMRRLMKSNNAMNIGVSQAVFIELEQHVKETRKQLANLEQATSLLVNFDIDWPLDISRVCPNPSKKQSDLRRATLMTQEVLSQYPVDVRVIMKDALNNVLSESRQSIEKLSLTTSEEEVGLEILQLFIQDLLGRDTASAKIFAVKAEEDYVTQPVVSMSKKIISAVLLILFNALCIYYSILRGYRKGLAWQRSFLMACIVQFLIEVFYNETLLCLYVHCFVPSIVPDAEIKRVQSVLHHCIHSMCNDFFDPNDHSETDKQLLNVADYFFVSTHVAKAYPDLMESMIVLAYKSFMSGAIGHKWKRDEDVSYDHVGESDNLVMDRATNSQASMQQSFVRKVIISIAIAISALQTMVVTSIPLSYQKMIVRFLEPIVWGGLSYTWLLISNSTIGISIFAILVAAIVFIILHRYYRDTKKAKNRIAADAMFIQDLVDFENVWKRVSMWNEHQQYALSSNTSTMSSDVFETMFGQSVSKQSNSDFSDASGIDLSISWTPSLFEEKEDSSDTISLSRKEERCSSDDDISHCSFKDSDELI